jgi:hypothetical protein
VADFISFNEGRKELANNGLPATLYFLLSSKDCNTHVVGDTLAGGVGEITGTGYARQSEAEPTASAANPSAVAFAQKTWATGAATDWPASVKSVVLATTRQHGEGDLRLEPRHRRHRARDERRDRELHPDPRPRTSPRP